MTDITHTQTAGPSDEPTASDVAPTAPRYELLAEIDRGGMGVVWRAKQTGLNRVVALKTLLGADPANPLATVRFLAEAEAVATAHDQGGSSTGTRSRATSCSTPACGRGVGLVSARDASRVRFVSYGRRSGEKEVGHEIRPGTRIPG